MCVCMYHVYVYTYLLNEYDTSTMDKLHQRIINVNVLVGVNLKGLRGLLRRGLLSTLGFNRPPKGTISTLNVPL